MSKIENMDNIDKIEKAIKYKKRKIAVDWEVFLTRWYINGDISDAYLEDAEKKGIIDKDKLDKIKAKKDKIDTEKNK